MPHGIRPNHWKLEICKALLKPLISWSAPHLRVKSYSCQAAVFEVPRNVKQCMRPHSSSWSGEWRDDRRELKAGALGSAAACLQSLLLPSSSLLHGSVPGLLILGATDPWRGCGRDSRSLWTQMGKNMLMVTNFWLNFGTFGCKVDHKV